MSDNTRSEPATTSDGGSWRSGSARTAVANDRRPMVGGPSRAGPTRDARPQVGSSWRSRQQRPQAGVAPALPPAPEDSRPVEGTAAASAGDTPNRFSALRDSRPSGPRTGAGGRFGESRLPGRHPTAEPSKPRETADDRLAGLGGPGLGGRPLTTSPPPRRPLDAESRIPDSRFAALKSDEPVPRPQSFPRPGTQQGEGGATFMSERVAGGLGAVPRAAPARKLADDEKIPSDRFQALAGDRMMGGPGMGMGNSMGGMMGGRPMGGMMGGRPMGGMMGGRPGGRMSEAFASSGSRDYPGISGLKGAQAAGGRPASSKPSKAVEAIAAAAKASAAEAERVKGAAGDVTGTLASQMSESEAMATVRLSVDKHLDTLQQSMAGEGDVAKATEAIRGAAGASEPFALLSLDLIVRRMILCQRGGDAKVLGALLASLAGVQSKKAGKGRRGKSRRGAGPAASDAAASGLVSVEQVVATLESAAAFLLGGEPANDSVLRDAPRALASGSAAEEARAAVDRAVEAASKAGEELAEDELEAVARRAKDSVLSRAQSFPRSLKEGVAEAIEAGLFDKAAMPGRELRRLCAQEGMEGVPEPDAVVEAPSAAAVAAAAASAEPANVRVAAAVEAALASGLVADEAVEAVTAAAGAVPGAESTDVAWGITRAVLKAAIVREQLTLSAPWAADEALGPVVSSVCDEKLAESVAALDAVVSVAIDLSFPNGMLVGAFKGLFDEDCIDDAAFEAWKTGPRGPLSGKAKGKALKQLADFFVWLEKEMAESDEEEEEDDDEEA